MKSINLRIAEELNVNERQVAAAVDLLDSGSTVPFIARYRKEATGQLDDTQLRNLEERLRYLREMEDRRKAILDSIREQGKLEAALERTIMEADTKARLEDIYLPFKPKRRSKALIAIEAGLAPLADALIGAPERDPQEQASAFVNAEKAINTPQEALDGARAILVERFSENAELVGALREQFWTQGRLVSAVRKGKETEGAKFSDYFDSSEPFTRLKSHRILAMFRGEKEEMLDLKLDPDVPGGATPGVPGPYERKIAHQVGITDNGRPGDRWLMETVRWAWRTRLLVHLAVDLRMRLWQLAEEEAAASEQQGSIPDSGPA